MEMIASKGAKRSFRVEDVQLQVWESLGNGPCYTVELPTRRLAAYPHPGGRFLAVWDATDRERLGSIELSRLTGRERFSPIARQVSRKRDGGSSVRSIQPHQRQIAGVGTLYPFYVSSREEAIRLGIALLYLGADLLGAKPEIVETGGAR